MRSGKLVWVLAAVVWAGGCGKLGQLKTTFAHLSEVRTAVSQLVACEEVGVRLVNGVHLEVSVVNVKNAPTNEENRKDLAWRIARRAYSAYRGEAPAWNVHVYLVTRRTYLFLFHRWNSVGYRFGAGQLRGAADPPEGNSGLITRFPERSSAAGGACCEARHWLRPPGCCHR